MVTRHPEARTEPFTLGEFRVDPVRRIISGPNAETKVEPKVMAVLVMLAARPGKVVTRQEFIESIWAKEYGGDESLSRAISQLRKALGDVHGKHRYIKTVPKTGYLLSGRLNSGGSEGNKLKHRRVLVLTLVGFLVLLAVAVFYQLQRMNGDSPEPAVAKASIVLAVLPFDIQGASTEDQPLAFGVADEILSALSRNPSISVIAGNSSFQFQGERKNDLAMLHNKLNISHVVDGSLRRSSEGLRVGVHLIDTGSGLVEWSDVVTRPESEIYTIPGEVATAVQAALGTEPVAMRSRLTAPDPVAYESYLYAKVLLHTPWGVNLETAIEKLEHAVTLDPRLSEAWSTLALIRVEQNINAGPSRPEPGSPAWSQRLREARQHANTALIIDPESIEALLAIALIDYREQAVTLAETIDQVHSLLPRAPNNARLNFRMGLLMGTVGRFQEGTRHFGKALELDPLTLMNAAFYADQLLCSGRMEEALDFIRAQGVYEQYQHTYTGLVMSLLSGDFQTARDNFTDLGPNDVFLVDRVANLPSLKVNSLNTQRLSQLMARLIDVAKSADALSEPTLASDLELAADEGLILHFYVAQLLAAGGLQDAAIDLVRKRIAVGDSLVHESGILLRPAFSKARQDPRIMAFMEETGQLDYWLQKETWPDYCSDPELPYDCISVARQLRAGPNSN